MRHGYGFDVAEYTIKPLGPDTWGDFAYERPKGKGNCVMKATIAPR